MSFGEGEGFDGGAGDVVGGEGVGGGGGEVDEPDGVDLFGGGQVGVGFGVSGRDAPGAVAEVEDAVGVGFALEKGVGAFVDVVVVFEGGGDGVFLEEGDPGGADEFGLFGVVAVVGGVGGDVVDGEESGDVVAGVEGGFEPHFLFAVDGVEVVGVEEEKGAIGAEVEGAVGGGGAGKGHELKEEGGLLGLFLFFFDVVVADDGDEGDDAAVGCVECLGDDGEELLPSADGGVFPFEEFADAFGVGDVSADDDEVGVEGGDGAVHLKEGLGLLIGVASDDDAYVAGEF